MAVAAPNNLATFADQVHVGDFLSDLPRFREGCSEAADTISASILEVSRVVRKNFSSIFDRAKEYFIQSNTYDVMSNIQEYTLTKVRDMLGGNSGKSAFNASLEAWHSWRERKSPEALLRRVKSVIRNLRLRVYMEGLLRKGGESSISAVYSFLEGRQEDSIPVVNDTPYQNLSQKVGSNQLSTIRDIHSFSGLFFLYEQEGGDAREVRELFSKIETGVSRDHLLECAQELRRILSLLSGLEIYKNTEAVIGRFNELTMQLWKESIVPFDSFEKKSFSDDIGQKDPNSFSITGKFDQVVVREEDGIESWGDIIERYYPGLYRDNNGNTISDGNRERLVQKLKVLSGMEIVPRIGHIIKLPHTIGSHIIHLQLVRERKANPLSRVKGFIGRLMNISEKQLVS